MYLIRLLLNEHKVLVSLLSELFYHDDIVSTISDQSWLLAILYNPNDRLYCSYNVASQKKYRFIFRCRYTIHRGLCRLFSATTSCIKLSPVQIKRHLLQQFLCQVQKGMIDKTKYVIKITIWKLVLKRVSFFHKSHP